MTALLSQFIEMFEGHGYPDVKAGQLLSDMRNGVSPSKNGRHVEKVLTLSAITQGVFDSSAWKEGSFDECPPDSKRVSTSELYICRGNGNKHLVGSAAFSAEKRPDLVFPDTVIAAHIDMDQVLLPYLYIAWQMPFLRDQIEENARTTNGTYKINQSIIANLVLPLPPLGVQKVFSDIVEQSDKSKFVYSNRNLSRCLAVWTGINVS